MSRIVEVPFKIFSTEKVIAKSDNWWLLLCSEEGIHIIHCCPTLDMKEFEKGGSLLTDVSENGQYLDRQCCKENIPEKLQILAKMMRDK